MDHITDATLALHLHAEARKIRDDDDNEEEKKDQGTRLRR